MGKKKKKEINMLEGSLADKIILFAFPLALTGMLQQLFNAADIAVIGQFCGTDSMAAVGCNSPVIGLLVNLFVGIALGANVVIARCTGQRRPDRANAAVHTSVLLALICGFGVMILGELIAVPFLQLLGVPAGIMGKAALYLRIYLLGLPVMLLYNFEAAIFRSQGDTRTPLICLIVSGVSNVCLNLFFVLVIHMDVAGVATATVLANCISSALLFHFLRVHPGPIRLRPGRFHMDKILLRDIIRIGLPAGLQGAVFSISNLVIQSAINSLGADIIAASAAAFNVEILAYFLVNSFGQAATTFIGQNYGAGNIPRCYRVARVALLLNILISQSFSLTLIFFASPLLHIFNGSAVVIEYGTIRMKYILYGEFINCVIETLSGAMRGYGASLAPALTALIGICGIRIAWCYTVFRADPTYQTLVLVYPVSWAVTAAAISIIYLLYRKKILTPQISPAR
ncbi:MAG: MATE family efflux transporter [Anaerovoracaceae bacterium]|jgi:putative MATE family efflux protein